MDNIKIIGFANWIDFKKQEITFWCPTSGEKLRLDMFTGIETYNKLNKEQRKKVLELIMDSKGRFVARGYCYNSFTFIADEIVFDETDEIDAFVKECVHEC